MKIVILTSDIIDGLIISQSIVRSGKDVRAIVYERRKKTIKSSLKRMFFQLKGVLDHTGYEGISAKKRDLTLKEVGNINSEEVRSFLNGVDPDLIAVIGTRKLKKEIFGIARFGAINMHSGILPYYRGADSEFWALYNGEKDKIGVSIHFIGEKLDAGDIILQARQHVAPDDDHKKLRMKNILLGADKMIDAIGLIESGSYERVGQDEALARTYRSATGKDIKEYYGRTL